MKYQFALPALGLLAAAACSGTNSTAPNSGMLTQRHLAASSEPEARGGNLSLSKDCNTTFTGAPGSYCTIVGSNLKEIPTKSRIYYLGTPLDVFGPSGTDVKLDVPGPGNNAASGHCTLNLTTSLGLCTFSGGTGKFSRFNASLRVSDPKNNVWQLNGQYSYGD